MSLMFTAAIVIGGVLTGAATIPGYIYLLGKDIDLGTDIGGRIMFTAAQLITGGSVLDYQADGNYQYRRLTQTPDDADIETDWTIVNTDGTLESFEPNGNLGRLGKKPFAVTYESDNPEMFREINHTEGDVLAQSQDAVIYQHARAGVQSFRHKVDDLGDRILVSLRKLDQELMDAGLPEIADRQKEHAMQIYGGDTTDIDTKWLVLGGILCVFAGAGIALMVV